MNKIYNFIVFTCFLFSSGICFSQGTAYCGSQRYDQEIFSTVKITTDVVFGSSIDNAGNTVILTMDIYEPDGDVATIRPLIVWAHGGSFMGGTKNDADVVSLSNHFAKRGYVCASINYRLGISIPPNQSNATQAVYRAVQDMKASVRFFRQDAATANTFKIDPDFIVAGGSSAGAFTALHLAYLDQPSELPAQIDTNLLGGMEGNSGNPGYASTVNAVVNLCGALGNKTWVIPGDKPLCSMHGTADNVVPYATATLYLLNIFAIMPVDGSYSINEYANTIGLPNVMYTWFGKGHVPYAGSLSDMDTTVRFVSNFLYTQMGCAPTDPNPLPNTFVTTGIKQTALSQSEISIYPQPATDRIYIGSENGDQKILRVELFDMAGKKMREVNGEGKSKLILEKEGLTNGIYFLSIQTLERILFEKICFE